MAKEVDQRLVQLRAALKKADGGKGVDAFIVPSEDAHMVRCRPLPWTQPAACATTRPSLLCLTGAQSHACVQARTGGHLLPSHAGAKAVQPAMSSAGPARRSSLQPSATRDGSRPTASRVSWIRCGQQA